MCREGVMRYAVGESGTELVVGLEKEGEERLRVVAFCARVRRVLAQATCDRLKRATLDSTGCDTTACLDKSGRRARMKDREAGRGYRRFAVDSVAGAGFGGKDSPAPHPQAHAERCQVTAGAAPRTKRWGPSTGARPPARSRKIRVQRPRSKATRRRSILDTTNHNQINPPLSKGWHCWHIGRPPKTKGIMLLCGKPQRQALGRVSTAGSQTIKHVLWLNTKLYAHNARHPCYYGSQVCHPMQ